MKTTIKGTCPQCGKEWSLEVEEKDYVDFMENGKFAQYAFPYLSMEDRELLISGICNECWQTLFPDEEEDQFDIYDMDEEIEEIE